MPIPDRLNPTFGTPLPQVPVQFDPKQEAREKLICGSGRAGCRIGHPPGEPVGALLPLVQSGAGIVCRGGAEGAGTAGGQGTLGLPRPEIPRHSNTVAGAVRSACGAGVRMVNVHAFRRPGNAGCGPGDALAGFADPPKLLAVTVLTSMDQAQVNATGVERSPENRCNCWRGCASMLNQWLCLFAGGGCFIRAMTGPRACLVIPGFARRRRQGRSETDCDPADALRAGASYLVVGRPITQAADPHEAAEKILAEMAAALEGDRLFFEDAAPAYGNPRSQGETWGTDLLLGDKKKPGLEPGFSCGLNLNRRLKFFVEIAYRARDVDSAGDAALAVFNALDDARRLTALGNSWSTFVVSHYLLAITGLCNLLPWAGCFSFKGVSLRSRAIFARGFNGAVLCYLSSQLDCTEGAGLVVFSLHEGRR